MASSSSLAFWQLCHGVGAMRGFGSTKDSMETLRSKGPSSIRELLEAFPNDQRLAYTTVQTVVYPLEAKKAIQRTSKLGKCACV
jgi:hypothetical protein